MEKYSDKIKDVTIRKFPGISLFGSDPFGNACKRVEYYYISFTEIVEHEETVERFLIPNKTIIVENENKHIVPFSFKTYEAAKDFAQYLPGMRISGYRFSRDFPEAKKNISYETFQIKINSINAPIYVIFTEETTHPRTYQRKRGESDLTQYYGNDLDKNREPSGDFWEYNKLVVDYFFTDIEYNFGITKIMTNTQYNSISEVQEYENENTHKFVLIEK